MNEIFTKDMTFIEDIRELFDKYKGDNKLKDDMIMPYAGYPDPFSAYFFLDDCLCCNGFITLILNLPHKFLSINCSHFGKNPEIESKWCDYMIDKKCTLDKKKHDSLCPLHQINDKIQRLTKIQCGIFERILNTFGDFYFECYPPNYQDKDRIRKELKNIGIKFSKVFFKQRLKKVSKKVHQRKIGKMPLYYKITYATK